jgi:hypothetical protein
MMSSDNYMDDPRAKSVEGFIAGLNIFAKYWEKGLASTYQFGASHDIVHIFDVGLDKCPEDSEDGQALRALGFHADEDLDSWGYFC